MSDTLYEYYDDVQGPIGLGLTAKDAQTFTPQITHNITSVKLQVSQSDATSLGNITVSIRATDGNGHPTGSDLASKTLTHDYGTTPAWYEWVFDTFAAGGKLTLNASTKYALVVSLAGAPDNKYFNVGRRYTNPAYAGGNMEIYSGGVWTAYTQDWSFYEYGVSPLTAPIVSTQSASAVTYNSCTGNGNITDTGGGNATRRGFCYKVGTSGDPTTADSVVYDDGDYGTGAFTKAITGLDPGTGYRVRAYAVNSAGTGYGTTVQVNTATTPTVTTQAASSVTVNSCTGNGTITDTGGQNCTRRGFCYKVGASGDPTTADSVAYDDGDFSTGVFTKAITGLSPSTSYRVRAYAVAPAGTGYGTTVQVNTASATPILSSTRLTASYCAATAVANITNTGGYTLTKRGVAYNLTGGDPDPAVDSKVEETGSFGTGEFTEAIPSLGLGVTVYARPYAYSAAGGYGYGTTLNVTTESVSGRVMALTNSRLWGYPADSTFDYMRAGNYVHQWEPTDTNPDNLIGVDSSYTASPWLFRGFLYFDLQGVPNNFAHVKLFVWVYSKQESFLRMILEEGLQGWPYPIIDDWLAQNDVTEELARLDSGDATVGQWVAISFNAAGVAFIKAHLNDYCKFCCMTWVDFINNYVPGLYHLDQLYFFLPQESGKEPYLEFDPGMPSAEVIIIP